jgi:hypothetical protein
MTGHFLFVPVDSTNNSTLGLKDILNLVGPALVNELVWSVTQIQAPAGSNFEPKARIAPKRSFFGFGPELLSELATSPPGLIGHAIGFSNFQVAREYLEDAWFAAEWYGKAVSLEIKVIAHGVEIFALDTAVIAKIRHSFQAVTELSY